MQTITQVFSFRPKKRIIPAIGIHSGSQSDLGKSAAANPVNIFLVHNPHQSLRNKSVQTK